MSIIGGRPTERRIAAHLIVPNGARAVEFLRAALGGELLYKSEMPGGQIVHAQVRVEESTVMVTEEMLQERGESSDDRFGVKLASPHSLGGTTMMIELYVADVDATFARAVAAGGTEVVAPQEMFYGDRYGVLRDPFGHLWALATPLEALTADEVNRRATALFAPPPS